MKCLGLRKVLAKLFSVIVLLAAGCSTTSTESITIGEEQGHIDITLNDVGKYHGHVCVCVAMSYKALQTAIERLWQDEIPLRGDIKIESYLTSDGAADTFEFITRVATRDNGTNLILHGEINEDSERTPDDYTFIVTRLSTGQSITLTLKDGIIPDKFYEMRLETHGDVEPSAEELAEFRSVKKQVKEIVLDTDNEALFDIREAE